MKIIIIFLLFYLQCLDCVVTRNEFITFFSPKSIFEKKNHNLFIVSKNIDSKVEVGVQFRKTNFTVNVQSDGIMRVEFENKKGSGRKPSTNVTYTLLRNVSSNPKPQCSTQVTEVLYDKELFYIFIQLDKPVYAPGHNIKFRVIVIDRDLKPIHMNNINIKIEDPFNCTMHEIKDLGKMYNGVFQNNFTLSEYTQLGDWKIHVVVDKIAGRQVSKLIPVQKYVLPLFSVTLTPAYKHLRENQKLELTFYARYPYGDYVAGEAEIVISRSSDNAQLLRRSYKNILDTQNASFHITNDLNIRIDKQTDFDLMVIFTEPESGKSENKTTKFTVHKDIKYQFLVDHPVSFYCGLPFNVRVYPSNWKNEIIYSHFEQVHMIYSYTFADGTGSNNLYHFDIVNGVALSTGVIIPENTVALSIEIKFINSDLQTIQVPAGKTYIQSKELIIDYSPKLFNLNEKITIHVASVIELDELIVVVMTRHGNIYSNNECCDFQLNCKFSLEINEKMIPESTVIVYALTDVNQFVYGEVKVRSETLGANHLDIKLSTSDQSGKSHVTTKTKTNVIMDISTKSDSKVYLLAFDKRLTYLRQGNVVTRHDVKEEASKFDNKLNIVFDNLKSWHDCNEEEIKRVESGRKHVTQQTTDFSAPDDGDDSDDVSEDGNTGEPTVTEDVVENELLRDHFPETWIFEEFDAKNEVEKKTFKVPDSITSWMISAFAIHNELGMAVADPTEVTVKNEFFVKMMLPYSIRFKEVLQLNILVYNYVESKKSLTVSISMHNKKKEFQFVNYTKGNQKCDASYNDNVISTISNVIVPPSGVKKVSFYIRSHPSQNSFNGLYKNISMHATAEGTDDIKTYVDKLNRKLKIKQFGVREYEMFQQSNRLVKSPNAKIWNFTKNNENEKNSTSKEFAKIYAFISSDYLSDVNIVSDWSFDESDCLSQRSAKFKACVSYYRYLLSKGNTGEFNCKHGMQSLYQTILGSRASYDYDLSYAVSFIDTILSAMKIGALSTDYNTANNELDYLKSLQNSDGSFTSSNKYFNTAFGVYNFLKYADYYTNSYSDVISKAFTYLSSNQTSTEPKDHAIAAYAYALNNDITGASYHMGIVEKNILTKDEKTKKNCFKALRNSTSCDMQHTAYAILAYAAMGQIQKGIPMVVSLLKDFGLQTYFSNTHDYFVASEAISTVISTTKVTEIDFSINLTDEFNFNHTVTFRKENSTNVAEIPFPDFSQVAHISTKGSGYCTVVIVIERIIRLPTIKSHFDIRMSIWSSTSTQAQIQLCTTYIQNIDNQDTIENVIMEVEVPSGYIFNDVVNRPDYAGFLKDVIKRRKDTLAIIYLIGVKVKREYCFPVQLTKIINVINPDAAGVKVYDFYNKDSVTIDFYKLDTSYCNK